MTGVSDSNAKTPNSSVDRNENASDELAIVFNVWPAWIARNDGGATPINWRKKKKNEKKNKWKSFCILIFIFHKFLHYYVFVELSPCFNWYFKYPWSAPGSLFYVKHMEPTHKNRWLFALTALDDHQFLCVACHGLVNGASDQWYFEHSFPYIRKA